MLGEASGIAGGAGRVGEGAGRVGDGVGFRSGLRSRSNSAESPHPLALSASAQTRKAYRGGLWDELRDGPWVHLWRVAITRRSSHGVSA
jgi:hypothetical protein